ncbi:pentapeptide repeat-containing protein [Acaryochloris marina]|uniref:Pentapeptide repeat protein n=1 Tax=Acaryochloris marina (strain MBIC 11017) TaxID=329726 RepID=B0CF70_ACAM1|nr:pentapeptide repeat-containing protein [Acaryochloris marina]ABW30586.1 pentapeptide repeat protein [Acaryochloris marina MBIC11017]BDM79384.1 hypothetical protein AM10699_22520 [Acaryochloris marina MBIC10699]
MGNRRLKKIGRKVAISFLIGSLATFLAPSVRAEKPEHLQRIKQTRTCFNCDLKKADLANISLKGAFLRETNLQEANLEGADLRFAVLKKVNFKKANLKNADFTGAILHDVNLDDADLKGATLPPRYRRKSNSNSKIRAQELIIDVLKLQRR